MQLQTDIPDLPEFLIKSTLGIAFVAVLLVTPFGFYNFIIGQYDLAITILILTVLSALNAFLCYRGNYYLWLNLYAITPLIILACMAALTHIGDSGSYWAFLGLVGFYFILPENPARIINIIYLIIMSITAWFTLDHDVASRFMVALVGMSFFISLALKEIYKQHRRLKELSITDPLTNLNNRLLLKDALEHAIHQSVRSHIAMTIIMFDIDYFKKINDDYGHEVGDQVLKSLAQLMHRFFRKADMMFRIGGEEFLVLLHNTDESISDDIAEEFRKEVENASLLPDRSVTISLGVSTLQSDMDWKHWMKESDTRLYTAKKRGRNQVVSS